MEIRPARAVVFALSASAGLAAIAWLLLPYQWPPQYSMEGFSRGEIPTGGGFWPHVFVYLEAFKRVWEEWYGSGSEILTSGFGVVRYPLCLIMLCTALLSCVLLGISNRNRDALRLGLSLGLGAWFLAYTFILRIYVFPGYMWYGLLLDYAAAGSVAISLYLFARFFSHYPAELDYAACSAINSQLTLPEGKLFKKLEKWNHDSDVWMSEHFKKRIPWFDVRVPFGGEGTWAFFDSPLFLRITLYVMLAATALWHIPATSLLGDGALYWGLFALASASVFNAGLKLNAQYLLGGPPDRRKIEWIYLSFWTMAILFLVPIALSTVSFLLLDAVNVPIETVLAIELEVFPQFALIVILLSLMMSMFYRGSIDPKLLIRRTSLYSVTGTLLFVIFVAVAGLLSSHAVEQLALPSQTGAVTAGVVTALMVGPVRSRVGARVDRFVDRLLPASVLTEGSRYKAAVVFNDLSGYTRLTEEDEDRALTLVSLFHKEGRRAAEAERGRQVKTIGDAVLMEFHDAAAALRAVRAFHLNFARRTQELGLPVGPVHSGIHFGPVVKARDGDIFGGTVNLAARLQGIAGADEIVLSAAAKDTLQAGEFSLTEIGAKALKNVAEPVLCYRVA